MGANAAEENSILFGFPWKDKPFPCWQSVAGGNDCGALSMAPNESASNDFNQFSCVLLVPKLSFADEHYICVVWPCVGSRMGAIFVVLSLATTGDIKGTAESNNNEIEKKLEMPSLALKAVATMAISHHQIENCIRRVHNKTRTLPFVFALLPMLPQHVFAQRAYRPKCRLKEIDNICLQMTCQPLLFIRWSFLSSFRSLSVSTVHVEWFLLSPPLPRLPQWSSPSVTVHKMHANVSIHHFYMLAVACCSALRARLTNSFLWKRRLKRENEMHTSLLSA